MQANMSHIRISANSRAAHAVAAPTAPLHLRGHGVQRTACVKMQAATPGATIGTEDAAAEIELLTLGLDRGLSATAAQAQNIKECVNRLEAQADPVKLSWVVAGQGPIYQAIDCKQGILDNIVELEAPPSLPRLTSEPLSLRACLRHTFTTTEPDSVRIVYDSTSAEVLSDGKVAKAPGLGWPLRFEPPALQRLLPEEARAASFRVTVLTDTLRVTRGDRGELRVYVADTAALPAAAAAGIPDPDTNTTFS